LRIHPDLLEDPHFFIEIHRLFQSFELEVTSGTILSWNPKVRVLQAKSKTKLRILKFFLQCEEEEAKQEIKVHRACVFHSYFL
jgi:hypothetical protein